MSYFKVNRVLATEDDPPDLGYIQGDLANVSLSPVRSFNILAQKVEPWR